MSARHLSLLASFALPALGPAACGARSSLTLSDQQTDAGNESCEPRLGSVERCNGLDDDCDGLVDEDLVIAPLGGPIVVRDAEGSTGVCSTCRWALSPQLRPEKTGLLALWELGFDGASPAPNIYARRLTRDSVPFGEPRLVAELTATVFQIDASRADRGLIVFCRRVDSRDRVFSAFVDETGVVEGEVSRRLPADSECRSGEPDLTSVWSGSRYFVLWSNRQSPFGAELEILDGSGRSLRQHHLRLATGRPLRMVTGHDRIAIVSQVARAPPGATLTFQSFTLDGDPRSEPTLFELESVSNAVLASVDSGWLVVGRGVDARPFRLELSVEGELLKLTDPASAGFDALFPRPGGGFIGVQTHPRNGQTSSRLEWTRADGSVQWSFVAPQDDPLRDAYALEYRGRSYVIYRRDSPSFEANEIAVRVFGCAE